MLQKYFVSAEAGIDRLINFFYRLARHRVGEILQFKKNEKKINFFFIQIMNLHIYILYVFILQNK